MRKTGEEQQEEIGSLVFGQRTDIAIGALAGYVGGIAVMLLYSIMSRSLDAHLLKTIWLWGVIPATTSAFIIYYLSSLNAKRRRLPEGAIQGGIMGLVAILVCIIVDELGKKALPLGFFFYCAIACGLTGFIIGYTFPEEYRKRRRAAVGSRERRAASRIMIHSAGVLRVENGEYPCHMVDLSMDGAKLPEEIPEPVGAKVRLELQDVGEVAGVIQRKEKGATVLKLFAEGGIKERLKSYLGVFASGERAFAIHPQGV